MYWTLNQRVHQKNVRVPHSEKRLLNINAPLADGIVVGFVTELIAVLGSDVDGVNPCQRGQTISEL